MSDTGSPSRMPMVIAHRGASQAFPENTLDAFRGASALGGDWVELDARRTADRIVIVHHDAAVAGSPEPIVETRAEALPASVPTLAAALAECAGTTPPLGVNVEIKSAPNEPDFDPTYWLAGEVVDLIHDEPGLDVLVTSFDPGAINRVHELDPAIPTGFLVGDLADLDGVVARTVAHGHVALNPWQFAMREEVVTAAHAARLAVNVWTVDDPEVMRTFADWGVDGIITNVPDVARTLFPR